MFHNTKPNNMKEIAQKIYKKIVGNVETDLITMSVVFFIALLIITTSCEQTEVPTPNQPNEVLKNITMTCYSKNGLINLKYYGTNQAWIDTVINSQNAVISYQQSEKNFGYSTTMTSYGADSLHLKAECDGKMVQDGRGVSVTTGTFIVRIDLNQMK